MNPQLFLQGLTRETSIRRDSLGRWFYDGDPLTHPNLVRAFNRWLDRAEDGRYCLRNDLHWVYVTLEGPPRFVHAVERTAEGEFTMHLSDERTEQLQPATLRQDTAGALYCELQNGLWARFDNSAMAQLADDIDEDEGGPHILVSGQKFYPPTLNTPPY